MYSAMFPAKRNTGAVGRNNGHFHEGHGGGVPKSDHIKEKEEKDDK